MGRPYGVTGHDTVGMDSDLYAPDGKPWCRFEAGGIRCVNGDECVNPSHRQSPSGSHDEGGHP